MNSVEITRRFETTAANTFRVSPNPPLFVRGEGALLYTSADVAYTDLVGGSATSLLGHGHPAHHKAIISALESGILHTGTRLPSPHRAALYSKLSEVLPEHLTRVHFANSGSEAIEVALKVAIHKTGRRRVISFEGGYHGRTLGSLAVTHSKALRQPFEPWDRPWVDFAPYAFIDSQTDAALNTLERLLTAEPVAAVVVEALQGVAGVRGLCHRFLKGVEQLTRKSGAILIADEIWTGFGRSGSWFSFEQVELTPDLVTLGKGLSSSLPISAVAGREEILTSWSPGSHTSTFQGNPIAAAAAYATISEIQKNALVARARDILAPLMTSALEGLPIRVSGAQVAINMGSQSASLKFQRRALENQILVYGGGLNGEYAMLLPPLIIPEDLLLNSLSKLRALML